MKKEALILVFVGGLVAIFILSPYFSVVKEYISLKMSGKMTVEDRVSQFGASVDERLRPKFALKKVNYPPDQVTFIVFKASKQFVIYARNLNEQYQMIASYPILAASGQVGPKLKEGDRQVPEGIYKIESFNPNSLYHLSLRVSYPNDFDKKMAAAEGRTNLGGDIMIHGNQVSIGCIALGDQASEDLFILSAKTGLKNIKVIICPVDFRNSGFPEKKANLPGWTGELYESLKKELESYRE